MEEGSPKEESPKNFRTRDFEEINSVLYDFRKQTIATLVPSEWLDNKYLTAVGLLSYPPFERCTDKKLTNILLFFRVTKSIANFTHPRLCTRILTFLNHEVSRESSLRKAFLYLLLQTTSAYWYDKEEASTQLCELTTTCLELQAERSFNYDYDLLLDNVKETYLLLRLLHLHLRKLSISEQESIPRSQRRRLGYLMMHNVAYFPALMPASRDSHIYAFLVLMKEILKMPMFSYICQNDLVVTLSRMGAGEVPAVHGAIFLDVYRHTFQGSNSREAKNMLLKVCIRLYRRMGEEDRQNLRSLISDICMVYPQFEAPFLACLTKYWPKFWRAMGLFSLEMRLLFPYRMPITMEPAAKVARIETLEHEANLWLEKHSPLSCPVDVDDEPEIDEEEELQVVDTPGNVLSSLKQRCAKFAAVTDSWMAKLQALKNDSSSSEPASEDSQTGLASCGDPGNETAVDLTVRREAISGDTNTQFNAYVAGLEARYGNLKPVDRDTLRKMETTPSPMDVTEDTAESEAEVNENVQPIRLGESAMDLAESHVESKEIKEVKFANLNMDLGRLRELSENVIAAGVAVQTQRTDSDSPAKSPKRAAWDENEEVSVADKPRGGARILHTLTIVSKTV